jgi:protein gp37
MSASTTIEWTRGDDGSAGATWNPVTGCSKVSPGCDHCYAETFAERFRGVRGHPYEQGFDLRIWPERLELPFRWRKPRRVFVNSMSDLFQSGVETSFVAKAFAVMWATPQHTYQVLTKRPGRMASLLDSSDWWGRVVAELCCLVPDRHRRDELIAAVAEHARGRWVLPNVWLGTSVESQKWASVRIPRLIETPATIRFLSCEPLLEAVDLARWLLVPGQTAPLHWVIVGGESGPGARPMHPMWAQDLANVCRLANVAFFFKQHGAWLPVCPAHDPEADERLRDHRGSARRLICLTASGAIAAQGDDVRFSPGSTGFWLVRVGKKQAGRELGGRTWDEFPTASGLTTIAGEGSDTAQIRTGTQACP